MTKAIRSELARYGVSVESVFDLLGWRENNLTAALAFTLSRSRQLVNELLDLLGAPDATVPVRLSLETTDDSGRTDLELEADAALIVIEAKRGWRLPTASQLEQYAARIITHGAGRLVTLSDCSPEYAHYNLPQQVLGVSVLHLPWAEVKAAVRNARRSASRSEAGWLDQLQAYLGRAVRVTDPASSWAYCVSVSRDRPGEGGSRTFIDFVTEGTYFHPFGIGKGWPTDPPNFMAFRWDNCVQRVHRVIGHEVVQGLQGRWPDIPETADTLRPHAVYTLGPALPMAGALPSGVNYRAARLWVLVDQLLTAPTLQEAVAMSKRLTGRDSGEADL